MKRYTTAVKQAVLNLVEKEREVISAICAEKSTF